MPKSIDAQIEDTKAKILQYQNKLALLEEKKLEMILKANRVPKKDVLRLIRQGKTIEEINKLL